jgi:ubiquitin carboxyl-terminal hydrolase 14
MASSTSWALTIKWGKETLEIPSFDPSVGAPGLLQVVSDQSGVPPDRIKLLSKSKGLWKGVLNTTTAATVDLASLDWTSAAAAKGGIQLLLMGSATQVPLKPSQQTVFLEDLPAEQAAKIHEPSGLANLGNTCYLNSVVQCLRAVQPLRAGLEQFQINARAATTHASNNNNNAGGARLFVTALQDTLRQLDRQTDAYQPGMLVQATRMNFPQFAQRGPHGQPQQQDAEVSVLLEARMREEPSVES